MTKADIVARVAEATGFTFKLSCELVDDVFCTLKNTLETGQDVKITRFGNFEIKQKYDRLGRNPQTGEAITIEARKVLIFKASNMLKAALNGTECRCT